MLKNILKLEGAQQLTTKEQKSISGAGSVPVCQRPDILICCPDGICACAPKGTPCMLT
ncbi:hypothetical protein OIU80_15395 [Flavobacterium sp. LS1R47]|jgi:hypothetical protein|uniref:Uncharacterized protein n=1 Tax=Flavobacterium frigoritolerans TaxID=2987686 RepID=A0A9X2ZPR6_9FLAO|nr:hypothetical protein [Flavobacterium frigoritolerans]MCV9933667.1 hypothetical protein [Flavobacterium frigoritolerans]